MSEEEFDKLDTNVFNYGLEIIKKYWNCDYGSLNVIKENENIILELTTGGWSDNEKFIEQVKETWFWFLWWQESKRGGYYKFKYSEVIKYE